MNDEKITLLAKEKNNNFSNFIQNKQTLLVPLILLCLNLLNVIDRFIVSSVLIEIESFFQISKSTAGLLQTTFLLVYMASSPFFGYLGDRIDRKYQLLLSTVVWLCGSVIGSLSGKDFFALFVFSRCLFGVATGAFETIAVPIIGDVFPNDYNGREFALLALNLGPPLGTGLSYLISLILKELSINDWRYAMRVTIPFLCFTFLLILFGYKEPRKYKLKKQINDDNDKHVEKSNGFLSDVKILFKNKTYLVMTVGWIFALGAYGGFQWWSATLIDYSFSVVNIEQARGNFLKTIYSLLQCVSGVLGLVLPSQISKHLKKKQIVNIDFYLIAFGMFSSTFSLFIYLLTLEMNIYFSMVVYVLVYASFNIVWMPFANLVLDVLPVYLRSTGNSLIIMSLHLLGDSVSPYWIGSIADACLARTPDRRNTFTQLFYCTQLSFYPLSYLTLLSAALFMFASLTFHQDKLK